MSNVFQRAQAIRMSGEPWQNAVQRATSQMRYETQMGGAKRKKGSGAKKKSSGRKKGHHSTPNCVFNKKKASCRTTHLGKQYQNFDGQPGHSRDSALARDHREAFGDYVREHGEHVPSGHQFGGDYYASGGAKRKSAKGKSARGKSASKKASAAKEETTRYHPDKRTATGRRPKSTHLCYQAREHPGRCHLSVHGRTSDIRRARVRQISSPAQLRHREAFAAAARGRGKIPSGKGTLSSAQRPVKRAQGRSKASSDKRDKSPAAARRVARRREESGEAQEERDQILADTSGNWTKGGLAKSRGAPTKFQRQGGGRADGFSDTSSTRSSDFTSVSDTTSYTMSANSYDSSSLW
jgi:hypothetical protein